MASKLFMKGKQLSGAVANALRINCKDKDGNKSTVQAELNKLNNEVSEQNNKIGNIFSTEEIKTNDRWIDGKPIYRKTYDCGKMPNTTTKAIPHGLTNLQHYMVDISHSFAFNGTNHISLPYPNNNAQSSIAVYLDATNITIQTGSNRSAYSAYITLLYTKTTD